MLRLVALALVAGFAVLGAWAGTTPLIAVAGLALWLSALDLLEPMAQESDHPDRMDGGVRLIGWVMLRLMVVPAVVQFLLVGIAVIPLAIFGGEEFTELAPLVLPTVALVTLCSMGGAALAVSRQATVSSGSVITPEITGLIMLWRLAGPPAIAIAGFIPMAIAAHDFEIHGELSRALATMTMSWYLVFGVGAWSVLWIRVGTEMREKLSGATAQAAEQAAADKAKANGDKK